MNPQGQSIPLDDRDKAYLWDILDACNDIKTFIKNTAFYDFKNDKMKRFAVERQLLVIGEASDHVSNTIKRNNPEIPWKKIIGLRNIIAHDCGEILVEHIWKVSTENIQQLSKQISEILKKE